MIYGKENKTVKRNQERKIGVMKITSSFCQMIKRASEISHNSGKEKTANFTSWLEGTVDGISDLIFAEDNYVALDREEEEKLLCTKVES